MDKLLGNILPLKIFIVYTFQYFQCLLHPPQPAKLLLLHMPHQSLFPVAQPPKFLEINNSKLVFCALSLVTVSCTRCGV